MRFSSCLLLALSVLSLNGCGSSTSEKPATRSCPDWSSNPVHNYQNTDFSNFGCAYYNNIAVQVENPDDLQKGHGQSVGEGDRESAVIQKYETATPQTAPNEGTSSSSR